MRIGGGPNTIQQYLRTGLIDELHVAISPVLLGGGERLFEGIDARALGYDCVQFVASAPFFGLELVEPDKQLEHPMYIDTPRSLVALAFTVFTTPTLADDCATVKSAMLNSGHTPHSVILTRTDGQAKKTVTRQVQTLDNKYVQTADGKWYAMNIAIKDLNDDLSGLLTCRRSGSDSVSGEVTAVYEVHMNLEGQVSDQKLWVSSKNMVLKSEGTFAGSHYITEYDFVHVTPPANALPMGGK